MSSLVAACAATNTPASLEGIKQVFHDPGFAVKGKTNKDQRWISETQEAGIRVLGWKRPKHLVTPKKPKALLRPQPAAATKPVPTPIYPPVLQTTPSPPNLAPLPKRHWWER